MIVLALCLASSPVSFGGGVRAAAVMTPRASADGVQGDAVFGGELTLFAPLGDRFVAGAWLGASAGTLGARRTLTGVSSSTTDTLVDAQGFAAYRWTLPADLELSLGLAAGPEARLIFATLFTPAPERRTLATLHLAAGPMLLARWRFLYARVDGTIALPLTVTGLPTGQAGLSVGAWL